MKISNSKKQLAKIIHENGGWREGMSFSWYGNKTGRGYFAAMSPRFDKTDGSMTVYGALGDDVVSFECEKVSNWHQTILSRDEYFHLYPVAEAAPTPAVEAKPTIEQLAADYRNAKDYADRKRREADDAKADAEAKLAELVAAGNALGLVLSVAGQEPELLINDWLDLRDGDVIEYVSGGIKSLIGKECIVTCFDCYSAEQNVKCFHDGNGWTESGWPKKWRFIRRP